MAKKTTTNSGSGAMKIAMLGASLAGLAAAYFFLGTEGKKRQKHAKAWAIKMKGDVIEKFEAASEISEPVYHKIIEAVAAEYKKGKKADSKDISALAQDLKKHWQTISASAQAAKREVVKGAGKAAKKAER